MRRYTVVDAFSHVPYMGNPVAVVLDAEGLSDAEMQTIARWTNLSETTFVLPASAPAADYTLRIFTPASELPFAGHPTLGSAHAILEAGLAQPRDGQLVQQCKQGLVPIRIEAGEDGLRRLVLTLPEAQVTPLGPEDIRELEAFIGAPIESEAGAAAVDVGPVWIIARVKDAARLLALTPDLAKGAAFETRLGATGTTLYAPHCEGPAARIEVRSFCPSDGISEDPVCGSGNGAVAVFRRHARELAPDTAGYTATQGRCVGRDGEIRITFSAEGAVEVGGACVTCASGHLLR